MRKKKTLRPTVCTECGQGRSMQVGGSMNLPLGTPMHDPSMDYQWMNYTPLGQQPPVNPNAQPPMIQQPDDMSMDKSLSHPIAQDAYGQWKLQKPQVGKPDPYFLMRGAVNGLTWLSNLSERKRQNQYMYNQFSTLGQADPMPYQNSQPNPYSLYMQRGGSMRNLMQRYYQMGGSTEPAYNYDGGLAYPKITNGGFTNPDGSQSLNGMYDKYEAFKEGGMTGAMYDDGMMKKGGSSAHHHAAAQHAAAQQQGAGGQGGQIMQIIQAYAQIAHQDPKAIMQQLQGMKPAQQQAAIQQMAQAVQQAQQQGQQGQMQQGQPQQQQQMAPDAQQGQPQPGADQQQGMMKEGGNWLRGAVDPAHKGWCTPMSNPHCTGHRRAFALMMKRNHGFSKKK